MRGGCSLSYSSSALKPAAMARSFSSRERPRNGVHALYICCREQIFSVLQVHDRIHDTSTPFSAKTSLSLVNAALTVSGVAVTVGQAFDACQIHERRMQHVEHREEDRVELLLRVL